MINARKISYQVLWDVDKSFLDTYFVTEHMNFEDRCRAKNFFAELKKDPRMFLEPIYKIRFRTIIEES